MRKREMLRLEWKEQRKFKNAFRCTVIGRSKMWVWKKSQWWERAEKPCKMGIGRSEVRTTLWNYDCISYLLIITYCNADLQLYSSMYSRKYCSVVSLTLKGCSVLSFLFPYETYLGKMGCRDFCICGRATFLSDWYFGVPLSFGPPYTEILCWHRELHNQGDVV